MFDSKIVDIFILLSLLIVCYKFKFNNFRVIAFAVITITCLIASYSFPARPYHAIFQSIYLTAMLLSSPSKSKMSCPLFKASLIVAAISFVFAAPALFELTRFYGLERAVYFIRNFMVYGVLLTVVIDFIDNPFRIFPYAFIGSWYVISDIVKLLGWRDIELVSVLYYVIDPFANHLFHIMLLSSIILLQKQEVLRHDFQSRTL